MFKPAEPVGLPMVSFHQRMEWRRTIFQQTPQVLRVEAAAYIGVVVHFNVSVDWGGRDSPTLYSCAYVFAAWMARKNWKAGRKDRVGAFLTCLLASHYNTVGNLNRAMSN